MITPWLTYNETYNCRMYVYYYMYGADVQNLTVTVERLKVTSVGYQTYDKQVANTYTGNLGDNWRRAVVNLRSLVGAQGYVPFRLRIAAAANGKPYGDVAIDSISFGPCPGTSKLDLSLSTLSDLIIKLLSVVMISFLLLRCFLW